MPLSACIFGKSVPVKTTFVTYSDAVKIMPLGMSSGFSNRTCTLNISVSPNVIMITDTI